MREQEGCREEASRGRQKKGSILGTEVEGGEKAERAEAGIDKSDGRRAKEKHERRRAGSITPKASDRTGEDAPFRRRAPKEFGPWRQDGWQQPSAATARMPGGG